MALFYFILKVGQESFPDPIGEDFNDVVEARAHARAVAGELMRNQEGDIGHWRVQVCDDYLRPCYECLFAEVDLRTQLCTGMTCAGRFGQREPYMMPCKTSRSRWLIFGKHCICLMLRRDTFLQALRGLANGGASAGQHRIEPRSGY